MMCTRLVNFQHTAYTRIFSLINPLCVALCCIRYLHSIMVCLNGIRLITFNYRSINHKYSGAAPGRTMYWHKGKMND